jgi:endonuclease I
VKGIPNVSTAKANRLKVETVHENEILNSDTWNLICMYNLVPAIGEINGLRSNYSFAMISGENREFGTCDMEIENPKAEPRPEVRGDIARIYFYMNWAYGDMGSFLRKTGNFSKHGIKRTLLMIGNVRGASG